MIVDFEKQPYFFGYVKITKKFYTTNSFEV